MNNKPIIPIFYACDDNFVKYTIVSLKSMIINASKNYQYNVYVLNTNISTEMKEHLYLLTNENFKVEIIDVSSHLDQIGPELPIRDYYSKTTYFRLFIAQMYPEYDKAIYIDSDTIVEGDIADLYNHDLGDNYVGACHEQVMIQTEEYGTYVEKVLGISRHNYFNAGILVINCHQFRKQNVLNQFVQLLNEYNFVVTQDEDYLNVICHNRVLWIDQPWNTEVFGEIAYSANQVKIFHYIMVSKPWHYADCRFAEHFWKYAKQTTVYNQIINRLNTYTDEQRKEDFASVGRLMELAISEINRDDNYLNRKQKEETINAFSRPTTSTI